MAVKVQRPLLVAGVGLTGAFWLLDTVQHSMGEMLGLVALGGLAATVGLRLWQKSSQPPLSTPLHSALSRATVEQAIQEAQSALQCLQTEAVDRPTFQPHLPNLAVRQAQLLQELERQNLTIALVGGQATGKTTLATLLQTSWLSQVETPVSLLDTESLFSTTETTAAPLPEADLLLFVTTGDLTDSEWQTLQQLAANKQRMILILNKQDQFLPEDQFIVLEQLRNRTKTLLQPDDVVAISAYPNPIKVRRPQADGSFQEQMERPTPEILPLTTRLTQIMTQECQALVWATTWRNARQLRQEVQELINQIRREQAMPVIEQYQWIAAATAFATPIAALDLLATTAINAQLVVDLGAIYQQKFTLKQGQVVAGAIASLLFKLGLVELSTQMIGTVLKGHVVTYVAGGALQGASAAYLTRLAGLTLVEFFQEQSLSDTRETGLSLNLEILPQQLRDQLGQKLQLIFQQQRQLLSLQTFVTQAVEHLTAKAPQLQLPAAVGESLPVIAPSASMVEETTSMTLPA